MANEAQIEHWGGPTGEHWVAEAERYDRMLEPFSDDLIRRLQPAEGESILDVGCGNGGLSLALAELVGTGGEIVGIDVSAPMLAVARLRARAAELSRVSFVEADAQAPAFESPSFDAVVSRFGVMFFDDPLAAFGNLATTLRSGGRVVFVCWRDLLVNEWMTVPAAAALQYVSMPDIDDSGKAGSPFSLADRDRIEEVLRFAALVDVNVEAIDEPQWMGTDVADTVEFFRSTELAATLLNGIDEQTSAKVWDAVAEALSPYAHADGVYLEGSAWLVTARRPG